MTFAVYMTETFEKEMQKFPIDLQRKINNIFLQLKDNPYVGDSLRSRYIREKRIEEKRIYYIIHENLKAVLIIAISGKKDQKETIDYIVKYQNLYIEYLEDLEKND